MVTPSESAVEQFFVNLTARRWTELGLLLSEDVERIGPFGDRLTGRHSYLGFLEGAVPADYGNDVHAIVVSADARTAFARVTEHLQYADQTLHLEETYAFGLGPDGLISRVEVFWQTPEQDPGGFGSATGR